MLASQPTLFLHHRIFLSCKQAQRPQTPPIQFIHTCPPSRHHPPFRPTQGRHLASQQLKTPATCTPPRHCARAHMTHGRMPQSPHTVRMLSSKAHYTDTDAVHKCCSQGAGGVAKCGLLSSRPRPQNGLKRHEGGGKHRSAVIWKASPRPWRASKAQAHVSRPTTVGPAPCTAHSLRLASSVPCSQDAAPAARLEPRTSRSMPGVPRRPHSAGVTSHSACSITSEVGFRVLV